MRKRMLLAIITAALALTLFSATAYASPATLKKGSSGQAVKTLQTYLVANGYSITIDGKYGNSTVNAVKAYQLAIGLKADGVAGSKTINRLAAVEKFIANAKSKLGCKYVSGGKGPNTFDCSGFVYWSLNKSGIKQSYMTSAIWQTCKKYKKITSMSELKRGDIISLKGHVAIYLGNGQAINALGSTSAVSISSKIQSSHYWTSNFVCGFRIF